MDQSTSVCAFAADACFYALLLVSWFLSSKDWLSLAASRKKSKSDLETLSAQLDDDSLALKPKNGRTRTAAPAGVVRFSDDEEESDPSNVAAEYVLSLNWPVHPKPGSTPALFIARLTVCNRFQRATKRINGLLKFKDEKVKRIKNVQQLQAAAVSDSEEDDGAAEQMAVTAQQQANALQAEEGDPEPVVLQQVLFPAQVILAT